MKKLNRISIALSLFVLMLSSCTSFDELKKNNNLPAAVPASTLLNGALYSLYDSPDGNYVRWCQYFLINYDYYGNDRYDFGAGDNYYTTLKNINKMEEQATSLGTENAKAYTAMADFMKAYYFTKMSLEMGDLPMTEALQGVNNLTPKYDSQKAIFVQAFAWLDEANSLLSEVISTGTGAIDGDIYYGNSLSKWQKLVNTFRLRLLIDLSKKTADTDLNVIQQFSKIISDPTTYPIMKSASDNLQFSYVYPSNPYPYNPDNYGYNALRYNCSDTYVSLLTSMQDPRVYITCEPAQAKVAAGTSPTDFSAFQGANPGEDLGSMYNKANNGTYSLLNRYHYYRTYLAEPTFLISYEEMCFNIAEAINRGWITSGPLGNAENYYKEGIKTSLAFYNIPLSGSMNVYFIKQGAGLSDASPYNSYSVNFDWDTYYQQPSVQYAGNNVTGLTQILRQKYLALYFHSGLESYFNYRRTGVPSFETGPGTGNNGVIPTRFKYFDSEKTTNAANYNNAISQYGGEDNINGLMWILK